MALPKIDYLKLEDLEIGMEVTSKQLERIYDTYIILSDAEIIQEKRYATVRGRISEISERQTCATEDSEVLVFNDSLQAMENGNYEE